MVRQILLVTEGVSEGDLLKKLFNRFCSEKVEIVEFKTNIYQLYINFMTATNPTIVDMTS